MTFYTEYADGNNTDALRIDIIGIADCDSLWKIKALLRNNGKDTVLFGQEFYIQYYDKGRWRQITKQSEDGIIYSKDAIGYEVKPGDCFSHDYNLWTARYQLGKGKYKLTVPYYVNGQRETAYIVFAVE